MLTSCLMSQGVQAIFKSLATLEKTVEKCHIELEEQKNRLTFTLHCKHGIGVFFFVNPQAVLGVEYFRYLLIQNKKTCKRVCAAV